MQHDDPRRSRLREGLMTLLDDVLFIEDPRRKGFFHPRIAAQSTYMYRTLDPQRRDTFDRLHDDFFYRRHNRFWQESALRKLPVLLSATRMLACGEDLGMIPDSVPETMRALQILSLEIQRMPKSLGEVFADPARYPYFSVCTTSTHDMNPLRAWWEENRELSERFYREVLGMEGDAPRTCEPWICRRIVDMHLRSPAMLAILPLQDWLATDAALRRWLSAPAGLYSRELGAQHSYYDAPDANRTTGCIRDVEHAYSRDGGLAVLTGNIARNGCIVKTAGVDESLHVFRGRARVYESQEQAIEGILGDEVQAGEAVVIRYEGPKGGPGMQEMLYPTSYLKSKHLDKACALITDGRFSGGTSGLSIGHVSPEAASGGEIAVVRTGDEIEIDIPRRSIRLLADDAEIAARMAAQEHFRPAVRDRKVPASLRAYAKLVSSADKGAVRIVDEE